MKKLTLALLLIPAIAHGQDDAMFMAAGLGLAESAVHSTAETKLFKMGIQEDLWYSFKHRLNWGFWLDNAGNGRSNSLYGSYQLGFDIKNDVFEAGIFSGPGLISNPDVYLGGHFQFQETLFFGITDKADESLGVSYNHFSSAGIEMPNHGRDFLAVELKFPF